MIICCAFAVLSASAQDKKLTLNAGFLFPNTLNAMIGYEYPLSYGNAVEIYGEVGNHWQKPTCCRFWKGYYWDGGLVYKQRLVRYKNGMLRFRLGPQFGATQKKFFLGVEAGFEYSYVFQERLGVFADPEEQRQLLAWRYFPQRTLSGCKDSVLIIV